MKKVIFFTCFTLFSHLIVAQEFLRNFPDEAMINALTAEKLPGMDAVIMLKEQSYKVEFGRESYRGTSLNGYSSTTTKVVIVKLLTEVAVSRYGTFEYSYRERFGDELPNGWDLRIRVRKPNGDVEVMDKDDHQRIVLRSDSRGEPVSRKIISKIPNLEVNDVLQIEFSIGDVFSSSISAIFYHSDQDYVMYSNLYITLPAEVQVKFISTPQEIIGQPQDLQISDAYKAGVTKFWSVKNIPAVTGEPYSFDFSELAYQTAFIVEEIDGTKMGDWNYLANQYYKSFIKDGKEISPKELKMLGFEKKPDSLTLKLADSLYRSIRQNISLKSSNLNYPLSGDISEIFDKQSGDASDCAYIMYKILSQWGATTNLCLIRDARSGPFNFDVPTTIWFNRLGVYVDVNGTQRFYDFTHAVSQNYETPWYLRGINVICLSEYGYFKKTIPMENAISSNIALESHHLRLSPEGNLIDSVHISLSGLFGDKQREKLSNKSQTEIDDFVKDLLTSKILLETESFSYSNFMENQNVQVSGKGNPKSQLSKSDQLIFFNPVNHVFSDFISPLLTETRKSHLKFENPLSIQTTYDIYIPEGYTFDGDSQPYNQDFYKALIFKYKVKKMPFGIRIESEMKILKTQLSIKVFPELKKAITDYRDRLQSNIILKKTETGN